MLPNGSCSGTVSTLIYICVMIDGRDNTLNDVLGSRSKIQLGNYLSAFPKGEREKVKYVTAIYGDLTLIHVTDTWLTVL